MLTDAGDTVYDPFGGSCVTGEVCERLKRQWICSELSEEYLRGAVGRFVDPPQTEQGRLYQTASLEDETNHYKIAVPGLMWNGDDGDPLPKDGGRNGKRNKLRRKPVSSADTTR